jgi:hypothetical protein
MKRLVWGTFLFLIVAAASTSPVRGCDWKTYAVDPDEHVTVIRGVDTTTMITSDDEFVTIVSYANSDVPSEWL